MGCSDIRLQIILASVLVIYMLIEWLLGKRASIKGSGAGSMIGLVLTAAMMVVTFIITRVQKKNNKGV